MDPTPQQARPGADGRAAASRRASATALDVAVARIVAAAVIAGLLVSFLALAVLHRGAIVRQLVAEVGIAVQTAATSLSVDREPAGRGLDAAPLMRALLELHAIERVTWLPADSEPPLCLTRGGAAAAPWQRPGEVPLGQWLGPESFRLAREIAHTAGRSDSVLVVEGSLEQAVRREAENVAHAARVFALVVLLAVCLAPWLGRRVAAPWSRALRLHHERLCDVAPTSTDPEIVLEAVERRVMADRIARTKLSSEANPAHVPHASPNQVAFLANTSHELRTPLHAIVTTSALLLDTALDAEQRALVERVVLAADALETSIGDLSELSSLERGELDVARESFRPEDVVDDAVALVAPLARDRDVELLPRTELAVPTAVIGDYPRLRRVLVHLVDNAVRHTEHGVVDVGLSFTAEAGARGWLHFEVRDSGVGIAVERQASLLAALHGVQTGEAGVRNGLGIGLALSSRIVRALGGVLEFDSAPGRGSRFRAVIPVEVRAGPVVAGMLTGKRVLVLGDRPRSTAHLTELLLEEGASVASETTSYAGFEALTRGECVDYVILSSSLAGRDALLGGLETLTLGRETLPRVILVHPILGRRLPVQALDEAVAAQLVEPVTRRSLRRGLELARGGAATESDTVDAAVAAAEPASKAAQATASAVRVLVVDDNEPNRQLVQYLLTKRGYVVEVAVDGQGAIDAFTLGEYDVVLMDCQMPGVDGFEATRRMRALERSRSRRTPILAMSAGAFGRDVQACRDAGMDDHIAKPFQPKELLAWLEVWAASALHGTGGAVDEPPRRRVTAREAGFLPTVNGPRRLPPSEGAVDEHVLGPLLDDEGGRSLAEELVALFTASGPETMSSLERRLDAGELDEVARIAHRFVSTSGSVGATRLARVLREVESACSRRRRDEASALLARASGELDVANSVLKRRFARASGDQGVPASDRGSQPGLD